MIMRTIATAAVLVLLSAPAFAGHCPKDVKKIDAALAKNPALSGQQMTEVKKLRDAGANSHKAGKHAAALGDLHKAMGTLGISH